MRRGKYIRQNRLEMDSASKRKTPEKICGHIDGGHGDVSVEAEEAVDEVR